MRDPYDVLGLTREATPDEIKSAFRRLAREHHPDRNPNDPGAQGRFQEINSAYQVLSDPQRRAQFDRFGSDRPSAPNMGGVTMEEWLAEIMGVGFAAGGRATGDLREVVEIEFEKAALGGQHRLKYSRKDNCNRCDASGSEPGTQRRSCEVCGGRGRVRMGALGWVSVGMERPCPRCRGTGNVPSTPCRKCSGTGLCTFERNITITVPPGIESGAAQSISGAGDRPAPGAPPGDLELVIRVKPHPRYERYADDVVAELKVPFFRAALGGDVEVETLHGKAQLHVSPGTQSGDEIKLRGQGIPHRFRSGKGDHICRIKVSIPEITSPMAKMLAEEFDRESSPGPEPGVFARIKSFFMG